MSSNDLSTTLAVIPATTSNLGPGFDCLGVALSLYNRFRFSRWEDGDSARPQIVVRGEDADRVSTDGSNLVYQAYLKVFKIVGEPTIPLRLDIEMGVPLARGLGSSATAIAAGLTGANYFLGSPLPPQQIVQLAIDMEGHPDNVVPALTGGCRLIALHDDRWAAASVPWNANIAVAIAIPNFELSTAAARQVLPDRYSRADAVFNASHLGLLVRGLQLGREDWLEFAMRDRLHQPYRQSLIPGFDGVRAAALGAGACELAISGAGPTLLALAHRDRAPEVATAMEQAWQQAGIDAKGRVVPLDLRGTRLEP